ncbi:glycosyltransferase [Chitinophaga solisilvae]|uniref:glycosyltransferase n=1 Tax=Chitinophaga solisilvae TaxID=1233460 RepID=UPI00136E0917|nr:glycosyltransferase [Chitinophaga solisilvae]
MEIGFVFTNYNNSHYTRQAVHSILLNNDSHLYIVIVDNKSKAEDVDKLKEIKKDYPAVHLILNEDNVGYFKGLNVGIAYLRNQYRNLEYIVIGNNDLVFPPDFSQAVQNKLPLFEAYPVISPDLITLDGEHQNPHVLHGISRTREFIWDIYFSSYAMSVMIGWLAMITRKFTRRKDFTQHETAQPIYQGYGACYLLGPLFFKHFDSLWAPTFLMGEEFFLTKQLEEKNLRIFYEPSIKVNHHDHATMDKLPGRKLWEITRDYHKIYRKYVRGVFY